MYLKRTILSLFIITSISSMASTSISSVEKQAKESDIVLMKPIDLKSEQKINVKHYYYKDINHLSFNKSDKDEAFLHDQIKNLLLSCGVNISDSSFYSSNSFIVPTEEQKNILCPILLNNPIDINCKIFNLTNYNLPITFDTKGLTFINHSDYIQQNVNFTGMLSCSLNNEQEDKSDYRIQKQINFTIDNYNQYIEPINHKLEDGTILHFSGLTNAKLNSDSSLLPFIVKDVFILK